MEEKLIRASAPKQGLGTRLGPWDLKLVVVTRVTRIGLSFMCPWPPGIRGNGTIQSRVYSLELYSGTDVLSPRRHVYRHILDVCTWHHDGHVPLEIKSEKIRAKAKKATTQ